MILEPIYKKILRQQLTFPHSSENDILSLKTDQFRRLLYMYINLKQTRINSPHGTIKFCLSCVEMIELLLNTMYGVWAGSWELLFECAR